MARKEALRIILLLDYVTEFIEANDRLLRRYGEKSMALLKEGENYVEFCGWALMTLIFRIEECFEEVIPADWEETKSFVPRFVLKNDGETEMNYVFPSERLSTVAKLYASLKVC